MQLALNHDLLVLVHLIQSLNTAFANERSGELLKTVLKIDEYGELALVMDDPFSSDYVEVGFRREAITMTAWSQAVKYLETYTQRTTALEDAHELALGIKAFFLKTP